MVFSWSSAQFGWPKRHLGMMVGGGIGVIVSI
jgi:hypothetical protein